MFDMDLGWFISIQAQSKELVGVLCVIASGVPLQGESY